MVKKDVSGSAISVLNGTLESLSQPTTFQEVLDLWGQAQYAALTAKHTADLEYSRAYVEASMSAKLVGGKEKPLTEKEKDHEAVLASEESAYIAAVADLNAKVLYNLMLRLRDRDEGVPE